TTTGAQTRSLSDTISLSDTTNNTVTKSLSDTTSISDTVIASGSQTRSLSDTISLSDTTSRVLVLSSSTSSVTIQSSSPTIKISSSSSLATVTVPSGTNGAIDFTASGGSATTPGQTMTITTQDTNPIEIQIQASTAISTSSGSTWNGIFQTANVRTVSSVSAPSGQTVDLVIRIGSPDSNLSLDKAMKITLNGQAGKRAYFVSSTGAQTEITATCDSTDVSTVTLATDADCKIDSGSNLIVMTKHATDLFTASTTSTTSGSGGSSDSTPPSVFVGFAENEFPLVYDGVNYIPSLFDNAHTAIIETGDELKTTLTLYENTGNGNVQHVEMYVNQFGSRILNDLTETIVIYDKQHGVEIIDPYNLIHTADILPSISENKAVFDFVIVFENSIPKSDILFRVWDVKRNSMELHLPDALIVNVSVDPEPAVDSVVDPEPAVDSVVDPEPAVDSVVDPEPVSDNFTVEQLSILKKWAGYDLNSASELDVLSEFGVNGDKIPSWVKQYVGWILKEQVSYNEFTNALNYLDNRGSLSSSMVMDPEP
ncbi:hypothetical protein, partial [Nitrosopumilus sp. S6]